MLASRYIPSLHQDYDKKKRCTFVHPWTNAEYLTGFMFWEIKKVSMFLHCALIW